MSESLVSGLVVVGVIAAVLFLPILSGIAVALWYGCKEGEM